MDDKEAIIHIVLDYIEGWYEGNAARMDHALSPHLAKKRVVSEEDVWDVSKAWMIEATSNNRGRIQVPENGRKEVTILDQTETMASVKIVSNQFIDYLHLARCSEKWSIINVLWDYISL